MTTGRPWWQVRPDALAWRHECDADRLCDAINPEDLTDWQFGLGLAALAICKDRTARMTIPEEYATPPLLEDRASWCRTRCGRSSYF